MTEHPHQVSSCGSCGAPVIWAVTVKGKRIPIDVDRRPDGTFVLEYRQDQPPTARVTTAAERERLLEEHDAAIAAGVPDGTGNHELYVSHFATCPDAAKHRRR